MSGGITVEVPDGAAEDEPPFDLPSGAKASMRRGKGRDVRLAMMAVGQPFDSGKYLFAMIARRTKVDGKQLTLEAIDDMEEADVERLMEEVQKGRPSRETASSQARLHLAR